MTPSEPTFTPRQGQYLAFIATYERLYGRAPAEADMQRHFGVTPPSVHQMILTLERRGLISRVPGTARSIKLRVPEAALPTLAGRQFALAERAPPEAVPGPRRRRPKRAPKGTAAPRPDPAMEYIDSELMTHRLRDGRQLSARMHGWYGVYWTRVRLTRRPEGDCTCPSDPQPCKHVRALLATWEVNPESFFDVRTFLRSLEDHEKGQLIEMIGRMVSVYPSALGALGVPGFGEDETDVDE
jgi:hypothetical protein